jgi:uncharacterized phage protein (TIGR01671 family)
MREMLFRGQRFDNKEWVYGSLSVEYEGSCFITFWVSELIEPENNYREMVSKYVKVIPETVGQFTGLLDKNGNNIFEGDIVKVLNKPYESKEPIIVVWGKKSHGWSLKFNCGKRYEKNPMIKYYSLPSSKNIEIIGNIHENK